MKPVRKSAKRIRSEILEAAQAAERDARAFNKLLVSLDPRVNKTERTIHMGLVWQFVAEYKRKMILLNGAAAVQDVRKLDRELVSTEQVATMDPVVTRLFPSIIDLCVLRHR